MINEKLTVEAIARMADCTEQEVVSAVQAEISAKRMQKISPERRKEISEIANRYRWGK